MNQVKKRDKLSVEDAILAMKLYEWSPDKLVAMAVLGNLDFDHQEFLKRVKEEHASKR